MCYNQPMSNLEGKPKVHRPIAVFDFDGTMISGDSIVRFLWQALKEGYLSPLQLPKLALHTRRALKGSITAEEGKTRTLRFLKLLTPRAREAFCRRFCEQQLMPRVYPKALERLEKHRTKGDVLVLLSASPEVYMRYLQPLLRLDAVLATPTDECGVVTFNNRGREKVRRLQAWAMEQSFSVEWSASSSYGDSAHDLPVMRLCGNPVMVNPKPSMLKEASTLPQEVWRP